MLEKIKSICERHLCCNCPFFDYEETECIVNITPLEWDVEEIIKRMGGQIND